MKAVILAAGEGKRLRPFTEMMPKVMLPVANKPIIEYVIDAVKNSGISEIIVVVGYKKEVILEHFKDYEDVKITYVTQDKQLGTAHALLQTKKYIKDSFIVLAGDNIIDQKSIEYLIQEPSDYALLIKEHPHPSKYGVVLVEKKELKKIVEKPKDEEGRFISTGIYKFPSSVFETLEEFTSQGVYALSTIVQSLVETGKKITTIPAQVWKDIVYPWDLISITEEMIHRAPASVSGIIEKGVTMKGAVSIGEDTVIYSGCYIVGPVAIGSGCEIGPNACIFPSTTIGNNTVIHPFSEIRNSVIMNDVHIGSHASLSHSIIGTGCTIESNCSTIVNKATIEIEGEYKKIETIGAMIGEDCTIGSHTVIEPGIILGRRCHISPFKKITKNVPSESKVM
ncbi:MAG: bifunctional sugar-1-phosphate nucleotidylyltransferase/acetyltransferase [Methanobacteriota archaeon]